MRPFRLVLSHSVPLSILLRSSFLIIAAINLESAYAATTPKTLICKKTSGGAINLRQSRCKANETAIDNINLLTGPTGTNGSNGAAGTNGEDGSLRIYGDGSAGAPNCIFNYTVSEW